MKNEKRRKRYITKCIILSENSKLKSGRESPGNEEKENIPIVIIIYGM